jgi:hypothetical protein
VDLIGCVNSAVNLTTEGSDVIDILKTFEENGATIATCGTCLNHYGRRDALVIGRVGTMAMAVEIMTTADKIIKPT